MIRAVPGDLVDAICGDQASPEDRAAVRNELHLDEPLAAQCASFWRDVLGPAQAVSWGSLLDRGSAALLRFPYVALLSGAAIAGVVLAMDLAGDALRDVLDPRTRGSH